MKKKFSSGYNLVEVLIAMAILGTVLLTVLTLFTLARGNVYSGKQMSHALSLGTRMMEDLSSLTIPTLYSNFSITSGTTLATVTVPGGLAESSYDGSIMRSTTSVVSGSGCGGATPITFTNDPNNLLRSWYCQMNTGSNQLNAGTITLVITPHNPNPVGATLTATNATVVRIRAVVRWNEGVRKRQIILDQVKSSRPLS